MAGVSLNLGTSILRAAIRSWPFPNGQGRIIDKLMDSVTFPSERVTCRALAGFDIDVLGTDHIGRHLIMSGQFDASVPRQLLRLSRPGDVIVDIGANIGYVSCFLLSKIKDSTVVAIEPHPEIIGLLRHNLAQFPNRAAVVNAALSDTTGTAQLNLDPTNMGASSLEVMAADSRSVSIETLSTSDFLRDLARVDLIKMDVEGHEETIFRAGIDEIGRLRPRAILFEDREAKSAPDGPIGQLLNAIGYNVYGIKKTLTATRLLRIMSKTDCTFNDYLALPE